MTKAISGDSESEGDVDHRFAKLVVKLIRMLPVPWMAFENQGNGVVNANDTNIARATCELRTQMWKSECKRKFGGATCMRTPSHLLFPLQ